MHSATGRMLADTQMTNTNCIGAVKQLVHPQCRVLVKSANVTSELNCARGLVADED